MRRVKEVIINRKDTKWNAMCKKPFLIFILLCHITFAFQNRRFTHTDWADKANGHLCRWSNTVYLVNGMWAIPVWVIQNSHWGRFSWCRLYGSVMIVRLKWCEKFNTADVSPPMRQIVPLPSNVYNLVDWNNLLRHLPQVQQKI